MKFKIIPILLMSLALPYLGCTQEPHQEKANCMNQKFDYRVNELLSFTVPVIDVDELKEDMDNVIILDAREKTEYEISHIEGARYIGYDNFQKKAVKKIPKDAKIVVYCSVGYRSEKIGEQLQKMGFTNVHNLFGSIFEWMNRGYPVVDKNGETTKQVHTYNEKWSQWVDENKAEKTW